MSSEGTYCDQMVSQSHSSHRTVSTGRRENGLKSPQSPVLCWAELGTIIAWWESFSRPVTTRRLSIITETEDQHEQQQPEASKQ